MAGLDTSRCLYVQNRDEWRAWLATHYASETEVWLVYYKAHTGKARVPYDDAVEEALCFGWIDSIVKKLDDETFAQKFTPRRDWTKWSALNRARIRKLIGGGRMTEAGLAKFDRALLDEAPPERPPRRVLEVPDFLQEALVASPRAREHFEKLTPSCRREYIGWLITAKREETRDRRLREAIRMLEANQKLGLK